MNIPDEDLRVECVPSRLFPESERSLLTAVRMTHLPTRKSVTVDVSVSARKNAALAREWLSSLIEPLPRPQPSARRGEE